MVEWRRTRHAAAGVAMALMAACSQHAPELDVVERVDLDEANALVRSAVFEARPAMNPGVETPLVELTTDETWERLGVQLFQVTEGVRSCESYLVFDGSAHLLCGGFGGHGIQSACVTDLDGDGAPELTYSHSWGSGIHRSLIGVARIEAGRLVAEEADVAYVGDLFVRKEADDRVVVEIGAYGWAFGQWTKEAELGRVRVARDATGLRPRVELAELSEEHAGAIWR